MNRDLGQLRVQKLIVHEVPRRLVGISDGGPTLSEIESPITQVVKNFFKEKIVRTLGSRAFDVEFDPATTSPVPELVFDNLGSRKRKFVAMSQEMANHLYSCQVGINPEGLLTVAQVTIEDIRALVILKLEKEEGVRVRQATTDGRMTLSVQHIHDLMLTGKTKVFKVGLFVQEGDSLSTIDGSVCDTQRGYFGTAVAHFFLSQFLGCRLKERPDVTTKQFFEATESFINERVDDPETKARYQVALLAEMNSSRVTVSPTTFALDNLTGRDRQEFLTNLEQLELSSQTFEKDTNLVRTHLARIQILFKSGITVLASPDNIGDQVTIDELENGQTKVEITDELESMRGRR
jgi:hypothetical protein